jgi:hypothetical protein
MSDNNTVQITFVVDLSSLEQGMNRAVASVRNASTTMESTLGRIGMVGLGIKSVIHV